VATDVAAGAPGVNSVEEPVEASAADDAVGGAGVVNDVQRIVFSARLTSACARTTEGWR
jgi:hypothetical protein